MSTDVAELFEQIFGGGVPGGGAGALAVDLRITDDDAAAGVTRLVDVRRAERCDACEGRGGATPDAVATACDACDGTGRREHTQGFFTVQTVCGGCRGRKRVFADPCATCDARGVVDAVAQVSVAVPAGITHGSSIRIAGAGACVGPDAPRGDLFVHVLVGDQPSPHDVGWAGADPASTSLPAARARVRRDGDGDGAGGGRTLLLLALAAFAALVAVALLR